MSTTTFEPTGTERGVLALESIGANDWTGMDCGSFDTTNTPDVCLEWQAPSTPARDIDATLREATDRYGDLLRKLAD